jgi:hypothetical protein
MFDRMGHTGDIRLVAKIIQGSADLVGLGVMYQESLELIVQTNDSIITIVK